MPKIIYYRQKCIGCNACVEAAPNQWRISRKDGKSTLVFSREKKDVFSLAIMNSDLEDNQKAARNCPMRIIQILN